MLQVFIGSIVLSLVHASIPNHWIPLVVIGKTERWSRTETLRVTAITGVAHTLSTIFIGVLVGMFGFKLSQDHSLIASTVAPLILVVLGIVYLILGVLGGHHHHHFDQGNQAAKVSKHSIVISLSLAMFFSPCIEIEAYYFTAGTLGWTGIWIV